MTRKGTLFSAEVMSPQRPKLALSKRIRRAILFNLKIHSFIEEEKKLEMILKFATFQNRKNPEKMVLKLLK